MLRVKKFEGPDFRSVVLSTSIINDNITRLKACKAYAKVWKLERRHLIHSGRSPYTSILGVLHLYLNILRGKS